MISDRQLDLWSYPPRQGLKTNFDILITLNRQSKNWDMADPELAKDMTAEQEEFSSKYEFLSHRFFKFNNNVFPSSARNIHFICLLCPRKTLIACSKKNTANLRMHIERQHGMHLEVMSLFE